MEPGLATRISAAAATSRCGGYMYLLLLKASVCMMFCSAVTWKKFAILSWPTDQPSIQYITSYI